MTSTKMPQRENLYEYDFSQDKLGRRCCIFR